MKTLIIGSGGRECAFAWSLSKSPKIEKIFAIPGNGGISDYAECVNLEMDDDFSNVADFTEKNGIGLTIVGPEVPLVGGIVDRFIERSLPIFGPSKAAAQIEGSKIFSKNLMKKYNIPTAGYEAAESYEEALSIAEKFSFPLVVKADGLAAGKGVIIVENKEDYEDTIKTFFKEKAFGSAGERVIIEEFLSGPEISIFAVTDGTGVKILPSARDYKKIYNGNKGPNTGGMGCFSPVGSVPVSEIDRIKTEVVDKTIESMKQEGIIYTGILYTGLIQTSSGFKVLEYNCRFGDPETQVVLPLLDTDFLEIADAAANSRLSGIGVNTTGKHAVCVVLASGGYPGQYEKGKEITFNTAPDDLVFHAGTKKEDGKIFTSGGRVLNCVGIGGTSEQAIEKAYNTVNKIKFDDMYYRKDIARI